MGTLDPEGELAKLAWQRLARYAPWVRTIPPEIVASSGRLFWDVDPKTLDPAEHEDFIVGRVLTEGDWDCVRALRRELGDERLRDFVRRVGKRRLDRRTLRFFETVLEVPLDPCEMTSSTGGSAPLYTP